MTFYISFGKYNKNYKYILLGALFAFLTNIIFGYIYNDNFDSFLIIDSDIEKKLSHHIIYHFIFRFLGILLISLIKYNNGKLCSKKIFKISLLEPEYSESAPIEEENLDFPSFNLFIVITILVLHNIFEEIYYKSNLKVLDFWMLELPLISILNSKISQETIYRHHKLAIYINIFFCTIYKIISLIIYMGNTSNKKNVYYKINRNKYFIPIGIIFYLLIMAPRAYALCQLKYLMDSKYVSHYKILIIYGIVGTVISIIIGAVSSFIPCSNSSIEMKICNILNENNQSYYFESFYLYWKTQKEIKNIII